jgi:hypothetical protein
LESLLETCHPSNRAAVAGRLSNARAEQGPKLFDEIVDIIRRHGPGGDEPDDEIDLELV